MDMGLNDKSALVLGAGGGLGGACARALAAEGAWVAVADRDRDAAEATVAAIAAGGGHAAAYSWDLSDHAAAESAIDQLQTTGHAPDVLVNFTGGPKPGPIMQQELSAWRDSYEMMVLSVIRITDPVLPHMIEQRWGRVITSTSSGVVSPIPNLGLSNALRSQLVAWSKTLANEVASFGVTSNVVVPGRIATPRITFLDEKKAAAADKSIEAVQRESWSRIPIGRYGEPDEYAALVTFVAGERSSYMTGSTIRVDGGYISSL
jgi:3-oxoacyl-[acyl-carrier protein] reductase